MSNLTPGDYISAVIEEFDRLMEDIKMIAVQVLAGKPERAPEAQRIIHKSIDIDSDIQKLADILGDDITDEFRTMYKQVKKSLEELEYDIVYSRLFELAYSDPHPLDWCVNKEGKKTRCTNCTELAKELPTN